MRSFSPCCFSMGCLPCLHIDYICEPNEKEGRKLLAEIMQGGNFGHYDERGKDMRNGGTIPHAVWKLKRVMRLISSYPEEAL